MPCYFCGKTEADYNLKIPIVWFNNGTFIPQGDTEQNVHYQLKEYLSEEFQENFKDWFESIEVSEHKCLTCSVYYNPVVEQLIQTIEKQKKELYSLRANFDKFQEVLIQFFYY